MKFLQCKEVLFPEIWQTLTLFTIDMRCDLFFHVYNVWQTIQMTTKIKQSRQCCIVPNLVLKQLAIVMQRVFVLAIYVQPFNDWTFQIVDIKLYSHFEIFHCTKQPMKLGMFEQTCTSSSRCWMLSPSKTFIKASLILTYSSPLTMYLSHTSKFYKRSSVNYSKLHIYLYVNIPW